MFHIVAEYLRAAGWSSWNVVQLRSTSGVVWWIFRPGNAGPELIGKCHLSPDEARRGKHEADTLQMLQSAVDLGVPALAFTSNPRPDRFVSLQTAVPGKPWKDELRPHHAALIGDYLERISEWIGRLQAGVRGSMPLSHAADELRHRSSALGRSPEEERLFSSFESISETFTSIPAVAAHGDLWPGNVLEMEGKIHVIDWATFHYGSPLEDLHNFVVGATHQRTRSMDSTADELWKLFFGRSPLTKLLQSKTIEHLNRLSLGLEVIQPLFQMFLVQRLVHPEFRYHSTWRTFTSPLRPRRHADSILVMNIPSGKAGRAAHSARDSAMPERDDFEVTRVQRSKSVVRHDIVPAHIESTADEHVGAVVRHDQPIALHCAEDLAASPA